MRLPASRCNDSNVRSRDRLAINSSSVKFGVEVSEEWEARGSKRDCNELMRLRASRMAGSEGPKGFQQDDPIIGNMLTIRVPD
jgi:hypothetical protein